MWRSRLWLLYCVRTTILKKPALTRLESEKSSRRYVPPKGTAGFARSAVRGNSRLPSPPARTIVRARMVRYGTPLCHPEAAAEGSHWYADPSQAQDDRFLIVMSSS